TLFSMGASAPWLERIGALIMLVGMLDAMTIRSVAPVWWFALLVLGALVLAAARRQNSMSPTRPESSAEIAGPQVPSLAVHVSVDLVVTAALIMLMPGTPTSDQPAATAPGVDGHAHATVGTLPAALAVALMIGHVLLTIAGVRANRTPRHRV